MSRNDGGKEKLNQEEASRRSSDESVTSATGLFSRGTGASYATGRRGSVNSANSASSENSAGSGGSGQSLLSSGRQRSATSAASSVATGGRGGRRGTLAVVADRLRALTSAATAGVAARARQQAKNDASSSISRFLQNDAVQGEVRYDALKDLTFQIRQSNAKISDKEFSDLAAEFINLTKELDQIDTGIFSNLMAIKEKPMSFGGFQNLNIALRDYFIKAQDPKNLTADERSEIANRRKSKAILLKDYLSISKDNGLRLSSEDFAQAFNVFLHFRERNPSEIDLSSMRNLASLVGGLKYDDHVRPLMASVLQKNIALQDVVDIFEVLVEKLKDKATNVFSSGDIFISTIKLNPRYKEGEVNFDNFCDSAVEKSPYYDEIKGKLGPKGQENKEYLIRRGVSDEMAEAFSRRKINGDKRPPRVEIGGGSAGAGEASAATPASAPSVGGGAASAGDRSRAQTLGGNEGSGRGFSKV